MNIAWKPSGRAGTWDGPGRFIFQNALFLIRLVLPNKVATWLTPSPISLWQLAPASSQNVGRIDRRNQIDGRLYAAILPGQRAIKGTPMRLQECGLVALTTTGETLGCTNAPASSVAVSYCKVNWRVEALARAIV